MGESGIKKEIIIGVVIGLWVGLIAGLLIMFFVNGGVKGFVSWRLITQKTLYNEMKKNYSIELLLNDIDAKILNKKYKLDEDEISELKETADYYIAQYAQYGYSEEEFLSKNGFESYDDLIDYLGMDYKRTLYVYDSIEEQLEDGAVQKYYDKNAFGKVNTKHILVKTSDDMDDAAAQNLANEIINKLNNGEEFDTLAKEYTANYSANVVSEELGNMGAFDNLDEAYVEGMKELEINQYSQTPVKSSFGYHIIYCIDKTEKTDKISNHDKMSIIDTLATQANMTLDDTVYYKALIQMREDEGFIFFDKELRTKYEEYCAKYIDAEE